jgi:hypothetical protein
VTVYGHAAHRIVRLSTVDTHDRAVAAHKLTHLKANFETGISHFIQVLRLKPDAFKLG